MRIVGVIHLLPLPGTPRAVDFETVLSRALEDAFTLKRGGVETVIVENFGDAPFVRGLVEPHIATYMTRLILEIKSKVGLNIGVNVLRNDARTAIAIAETVKAEFVRINVHTGAAWTDQGLIQGSAYDSLQYRNQLGSKVQIMADVMVKHATPAGKRTLLDAANDTVHRGLADAIIVTGEATGSCVDWSEVEALKAQLPKVPIWIGSGINRENITQAEQLADAVIIGTYFHRNSQISLPLDLKRVRDLVGSLKG